MVKEPYLETFVFLLPIASQSNDPLEIGCRKLRTIKRVEFLDSFPDWCRSCFISSPAMIFELDQNQH